MCAAKSEASNAIRRENVAVLLRKKCVTAWDGDRKRGGCGGKIDTVPVVLVDQLERIRRVLEALEEQLCGVAEVER